ncbi:outer membrane protein assembly factor BamD [Acidobacteria bacterium AH-259-A15]|nr:outer membrane protein assembly factor BamD [Acidobacteria bacterium AH-259-A15]
MMRFLCRLTALGVAALLLSSCGQKSAGLQEGAVAPDKTLFENGMEYLEKSHFIKARLAFQTLINTYPDSEYTPVAFLSMADSYYEEGGTENLLQAESQYKDFIIFYPTHEMADDSQMKIAAINVRLMRAPDRDATYARKAEAELKKFLGEFPDSELAPTAEEFLREVQENLAIGVDGVADFYFSKRSYLASESRYKEVLEKYPDYRKLDETLYRLGESLENLGRAQEASAYYARLVSEYPFSGLAEDAEERLVLLEKPVPPVDPVKAARNEANRKTDDGFSILDPIRGVWGVFTGREDPYEVARRRAEARKAQEQETYNKDSQSNGENEHR